MSELVEVRLLQVPVAVWQRASAHQDAIQREFDIMMADLPKGSVPHQLTELIDKFDRRYGGVADPTWQDMYAAAERGDDEVTLVFKVPADTAEAARQLEEMLDRVDEYCREGKDLLTLATPPELVSFRRWFLREFIRQIEDRGSPMKWTEWEDRGSAAGSVAPEPRATREHGAGSAVRFDGDLDLATAGALRDEILEARRNGADNVVVDLSGVKFVDSVGLSLLVTARNRLDEEGVEMRLVLPEKLRLLFEISGLTEVLQPEFVDQAERPAPTDAGS